VQSDDNRSPLAQAGPDYAAALGGNFFLDGASSSDADGDPLTFLWTTLVDPDIISIVDSASVQTAIIPLLPGTYTFQLQVSDGTLIGTDDITVLVTTEGNVTPIAKAGPPQSPSAPVPRRQRFSRCRWG